MPSNKFGKPRTHAYRLAGKDLRYPEPQATQMCRRRDGILIGDIIANEQRATAAERLLRHQRRQRLSLVDGAVTQLARHHRRQDLKIVALGDQRFQQGHDRQGRRQVVAIVNGDAVRLLLDQDARPFFGRFMNGRAPTRRHHRLALGFNDRAIRATQHGTVFSRCRQEQRMQQAVDGAQRPTR